MPAPQEATTKIRQIINFLKRDETRATSQNSIEKTEPAVTQASISDPEKTIATGMLAVGSVDISETSQIDKLQTGELLQQTDAFPATSLESINTILYELTPVLPQINSLPNSSPQNELSYGIEACFALYTGNVKKQQQFLADVKQALKVLEPNQTKSKYHEILLNHSQNEHDFFKLLYNLINEIAQKRNEINSRTQIFLRLIKDEAGSDISNALKRIYKNMVYDYDQQVTAKEQFLELLQAINLCLLLHREKRFAHRQLSEELELDAATKYKPESGKNYFVNDLRKLLQGRPSRFAGHGKEFAICAELIAKQVSTFEATQPSIRTVRLYRASLSNPE